MKNSDLEFPLAHFQTTKAQQEDTRKLFRTLNQALQTGLNEHQVDAVFDKWWPDLERSLKAVQAPTGPAQPQREEREILEEVLELVRDLARRPYTLPEEPSVFIPFGEAGGLQGLGVPGWERVRSILGGSARADVVARPGPAPPPPPTPRPAPEPAPVPTPTAAPAPPPIPNQTAHGPRKRSE